MGEFRIGRRYAQHTYPDTPRGAGALSFARNFAIGPGQTTAVGSGGTPIPWVSIESGALAGIDVPITPRVTGHILISGAVTATNTDVAPAVLSVQLKVNGVVITVPLYQETVGAGEEATVAFQALAVVSIGVQANVEVIATGSPTGVIELTVNSSTIEIEEKPLATG